MSNSYWMGLTLAAFSIAGCADRQHLTAGHGQSIGAALSKQVANPAGAPNAKNVKGLDSQEASIISNTYRKGLAPRGTSVEEQPMVIVGAQNKQEAAYMPPPSVPQERK